MGLPPRAKLPHHDPVGSSPDYKGDPIAVFDQKKCNPSSPRTAGRTDVWWEPSGAWSFAVRAPEISGNRWRLNDPKEEQRARVVVKLATERLPRA